MSEKTNAEIVSGNAPDLDLEDNEDFVIVGTKLLGYTGSATDIVIPDGITKIAAKAFIELDFIKSITIPASVKEILDDAGLICTNIEKVYFKGTVKDWCGIRFGGVVSNHNYELYIGGEHVLNLVIPEGVSEIADCAFLCADIQSVKLPSGLKKIGESAFVGCNNIKKVIIPEGAEAIGTYAFMGCDNLKYVYIPQSVKTMGLSIFCRSENAVVYCEASSKPEGWNKDWDNLGGDKKVSVIWGV